MTVERWWHDDSNHRRWKAWHAARALMRSVPTLRDWLFNMALRCRWDDTPAATEARPPWERP